MQLELRIAELAGKSKDEVSDIEVRLSNGAYVTGCVLVPACATANVNQLDPFSGWKNARCFHGDHRIQFFYFENGVARESKTVTMNDWKIEQGDWRADGKVILMESYSANGKSVILQVDRAGQASVLLEGDANVEFWWIFPSPDGRYGIIAERIPGDNNACLLERC